VTTIKSPLTLPCSLGDCVVIAVGDRCQAPETLERDRVSKSIYPGTGDAFLSVFSYLRFFDIIYN
jgi:hypothetical protein